MKTTRSFTMAMGVVALLCQTSLGATLTVDTTEPGGEAAKHSQMGSYTRAFGTNHANSGFSRGQTFTTADTGDANKAWSVTEFALKKHTTHTFGTNDTIQLWIFEWSPTADADTMDKWITGDGNLSDGDPMNGTGVGEVLVNGDVYELPESITGGHYLHFGFDTPLELAENTAYGAFIVFNDADATGAQFLQLGIGSGGSTYPRGRTLRTESTTNTSYDQDLTFYVTGTKVAGSGGLKLGSPFQDGMVLQRDKAVSVWGLADASASVSVSINGTSTNTTADAEGNWTAVLPAMGYGGPYQMDVISNGETNTLADVLIGDVWIAFGQSNMVRPLSEMEGATTYIDAITNGAPIRCLQVRSMAATSPQTTASMTWHGNSDPSFWTSVGTVFAYENYQKTGVPTAIIWGAWGSSTIEGWMPIQMTNDFPHFAAEMEEYYANDEADAIAMLDGSINYDDVWIRQRPNLIYNRMIHPLLDYGISGFVWYQGEANAGNATDADQYGDTLPAFVTEYRSLFGQGDLAFYGVQLPSYNSTYWPWFREAQDQLLTIPNAYVAVTLDTGLSGNIHPYDKGPIGQRLSLLAQKYEYGLPVEAHGPTLSSVSIAGSDVTVSFSSATGLTTDDAADPAAFEVAGADAVFHAADSASISGSDVTVSSTSVATPMYVRYAWLPYAKDTINLVNSDGLPAAPFRTDTEWADPAPTFSADPFSADPAEENVEYTGSIASAATGAELVFSNLTTGTWLSIAEDGTLGGTPAPGDVGVNSFNVQVTDNIGRTATATMTIEVLAYVAPDLSKYVDTFDGDGLDVNTGSGGGLEYVALTSYTLYVTDNSDNLVFSQGLGSNLGAQHGGVHTANTFPVTHGFTLDVTYSIVGVPGTLSESVGIGLIDGVEGLPGMLYAATKQESLGISLTARNGNQGLNHCTYTEGDAAGILTSLSTAQTISAGTDRTFSLTVDADGNYSYSVDGAAATMGTTTFDLTKEYHFAIYSQRASTGLEIQSVSFVPVNVVTGIGDITMDLSGGGGTHAGFSWYGQSGANYELQARESLTVGIWETVTNVAGEDAVISITEEMDKDNEFYRVKLAE